MRRKSLSIPKWAWWVLPLLYDEAPLQLKYLIDYDIVATVSTLLVSVDWLIYWTARFTILIYMTSFVEKKNLCDLYCKRWFRSRSRAVFYQWFHI
jgi:hypothetical protein